MALTAASTTTTIPAGPIASAALDAYTGGTAPALNDAIVYGWVSEGPTRGTWSLLYSCAFTIGICVWTAIHPNIRADGENYWRSLGRKLAYAGLAILLPEYVVGNAIMQLQSAMHLRRTLNQRRQEGQPRYSLVFCYYVIMGGVTVDISTIHDAEASVVLLPLALLKIQDAGKSDVFAIPDKDINDRSKADLFNKGLAICQIGWLVVQSIGRIHVGLNLTLLEIHALVQVISAVIMYTCWWYKPKDVASTTRVDFHRIEAEVRAMLQIKPRSTISIDVLENVYLTRRAGDSDMSPAELGDHSYVFAIFLSWLLSIGYASVHMVASAQWGARGHYFPTEAEAIAWDVACYIILGAALISCLMIPYFLWAERNGKSTDWVDKPLGLFWVVVVLAKAYIVLESFISLRAVPLAAYAVPSWTSYLPHF